MNNPIVFRKGMNVGQPSAEDDDEYLEECFVDNGTYSLAVLPSNPGAIALGRTGAGKSALLRRIEHDQSHVIKIIPENLSLAFLANSTVIKFFADNGVNLEPFYTLLWKHVFVVELLRHKFAIYTEESQRSFLARLASVVQKNKTQERAFDYLRQWGEKFWSETEYRTKELTSKLEGSLESEMKASIPHLQGSFKGATSLSQEEKVEVLSHGQKVVNNIQLKDLNDVIQTLGTDFFVDKLDRYYITIDNLDDDWVDEALRFKLIKSLIDTIRAFRAVKSVKILIALRTDMYYSMVQRMTSFGFQEEKLTGYYIRLDWTRSLLEQLMEKRVNALFKRQYSNNTVRLKDILPSEHMEQGRNAIDYILDRTLFRPREVISFFNICISKAHGKSKLTTGMIRDAEAQYSGERLNSLFDEWRRDYPWLKILSDMLRSMTVDFDALSFKPKIIEETSLKITQMYHGEQAFSAEMLDNAAMDGEQHGLSFVLASMKIFYRVGLIGLKLSPTTPRLWSYEETSLIDLSDVQPSTKALIHRAFHRALTIAPSKR